MPRIAIFGRALWALGPLLIRWRTPTAPSGLSTAPERWLSRRIDHYLERSDPPARLKQTLGAIQHYIDGKAFSDRMEPGSATFAWGGAYLIAKLKYFDPDAVKDRAATEALELLSYEYLRFADWNLAADGFGFASLNWAQKRPRILSARRSRRCFERSIACFLMDGTREGIADLLELMEGSHFRTAVVTHRIGSLIVSKEAPSCDDLNMIYQLRDCDPVVYGFIGVAFARHIATLGDLQQADQMLRNILTDLEGSGAASWVTGWLYQEIGQINHELGRFDVALEFAATAWNKVEKERYRVSGHSQRRTLWRAFAPSRFTALSAAVKLQNREIVALLIESCRIQAMIAAEIDMEETEPERHPTQDEGPEPESAPSRPSNGAEVPQIILQGMNDAIDSTQLKPASPVTYKGHSPFAKADMGTPSLSSGDLGTALPAGYFWSSHIEAGTLFWFLALNGEPLSCGELEIRRTDELVNILPALAGYTNLSEINDWSLPGATEQTILSYDPLVDLADWNGPTEQIICRSIGQLLPLSLTDALRAATRGAPATLTISPPRELVAVPWPIIVIPDTSDRLIERASLKVWTSTPSQLARAGRSQPDVLASAPLGLVCDNPDGTLRPRNPGGFSETAAVLLEGIDADLPGDKRNLLTALHNLGAGSLAVFYYRGHADHAPDPSYTALPLADGQWVSAGELFGSYPDGRPFMPVPSRVLVSACASSGSSQLGGESLGIAAGLIYSGADQLIATNVPIIDCSFTQFFGELVTQGLCDGGSDHADMLREAQLRMLNEWKVYSVRGLHEYVDDISDPHPHIWASYQAF